MEKWLVKLMVLAALAHFGMGLGASPRTIEKRSRDILKADWKTISVFPEEAKRFR